MPGAQKVGGEGYVQDDEYCPWSSKFWATSAYKQLWGSYVTQPTEICGEKLLDLRQTPSE